MRRLLILLGSLAVLVTVVFAAPGVAAANGGCALHGSVPGITSTGKVEESASVTCGGTRLEQVEVCPWYRTSGAWTQITSDCRTVTRTDRSSTVATVIPAAAGGSYRAWAWTWAWPLCGSAGASANGCGGGVFSRSTVSRPIPGLALAPLPPPKTFWGSTLALALEVLLCALLVCVPVGVALRQHTGPRTAPDRVSGFISSGSDPEVPELSLADAAALHTRTTLAKSSWWPAFVEAVDIAMIELPPEKLVLYTAAGGVLVAALAWIVFGSVLAAIVVLIAAPLGLRAFVQMRVRRQRNRFSDLLPSHLEEVAVSIRAGRSFVEALNVVTEGAEEPLRREFDRALQDESLGRPLEETLRVIGDRMDSMSVEQIAVVAAMHRRTGSGISEALDRVAEGARERADLQRELRALTAQGRLARWLLTFLPPVILLAMLIISPTYVRPLLDTTGGLVALCIGAVMVFTGSMVMKRIVDVEV